MNPLTTTCANIIYHLLQVVVIFNGAGVLNVRYIEVTATARTVLSTTDFSLSVSGITDIDIGADVAPFDSGTGGKR